MPAGVGRPPRGSSRERTAAAAANRLKPARCLYLCSRRAGAGTEEMAGLSNFEFFKILLPGMYEEALRLPAKFAPVLGARRDLKLQLAGGEMMPLWDVEVFVDEKHGDMYLRNGWKKFARAHDLRKGYTLVFRYDGARGKEFLHAGAGNTDPGAGTGRRTLPIAEPSHFAVTLRQCNLEAKQNQYLNVPVEFQDAHGYVRRRRVELQMRGRSWTVNLKRSKRVLGDRTALKYGWHQFCVDNGLEVGDVCFFRVIREGNGCGDEDEEWEPEEEDDEHVLRWRCARRTASSSPDLITGRRRQPNMHVA